MTKILTSVIATASLLGTLAAAQTQPSTVKSRTTLTGRTYYRHGFPDHALLQTDIRASGRSLTVYVITGDLQFGAVDLQSGVFLPIGPGTPPDVGGGLV